MSASVSCVEDAIFRRSLPTRRVRSTNTGTSANANTDNSHERAIIPIIEAITVVTFDTIDVAVLVTTLCTPPMSFEIRDCTSPVRVRVKNASERRWRWRKTAVRRSCITRWPTWFERSVCHTPSTPVAIAIAIIPPAKSDSFVVSWATIACSTPRRRNAGTTPTAAETRMRTSTADSRPRYPRKSPAIRRRFARRTAGSAGRSGFSRTPRNPRCMRAR